MDAIRITNLRSLKDTGTIKIKPISILVGTNSSGKSTFLRTFPLLKQSIETATESPILWFGRYVDFGTIDSAKNITTPEASIDFEFSLTIPKGRRGIARSSMVTSTNELIVAFEPAEPIPTKVKIELVHSRRRQGSRIGGCRIDLLGCTLSLKFNEENQAIEFKTNSFDALKTRPNINISETAYLIPSLSVQTKNETSTGPQVVYRPYELTHHIPIGARRRLRGSLFALPIAKDIQEILPGNLPTQEAVNIAKQLQLGGPQSIKEQLKLLHNNPSWQKQVDKLPTDSPLITRIIEKVIADSAISILRIADEMIADFAARVSYMGPFRATAERFYRAQDLSVREIDFRGENLAMFLRSLSRHEQKLLSEFTKKHFNFEVAGRVEGGHVEIQILEENSKKAINLADTGFGYSQMLPLIAQVWSTFSRTDLYERTLPSRLLAIEQPELHLHPAHQAKLADMLVGATQSARKLGTSIKTIIETHSENLINRMGTLIADKEITPEDVQIIIFEQDRHSRQTEVHLAGYDSDGNLLNWPFGFFSPIPS